MRVDMTGLLVAVVHKEASKGSKDGRNWDNPEEWFALLSQDFTSWPARVRLSAAQAAELSNPALFGAHIVTTGPMDSRGFVPVQDCATYEVLSEGAIVPGMAPAK